MTWGIRLHLNIYNIMHGVKFDEQNVVFAENQKEYLSLPAHKANTKEGEVTTCWELSPEEIEVVRKTGRVYLQQLTFGNPLQALRMSTNVKDLITETTKEVIKPQNPPARNGTQPVG